MKKIKYSIFTILLIFAVVPVLASATSDKKDVNILSWWGYLAHPEIVKYVEKQCNVKLSFDEYYSNDEFLRRWEGHKEYYDIVIFSDTIYNIIKEKIPVFGDSKLWQQSAQYHPVIKSHYLGRHYPHNVVYFAHSMTGFLWNPENISISAHDSIQSIFKKAANKLVVVMDDPSEAKMLVEAEGMADLSMKNFESVIQNANVYITNNYSQIYNKPEFAFSYSWSGEAVVDLMTANKKYQFLVHPKLSYVTSDLLAQTTRKNSASCVAKALTSRYASEFIQENEFYFAPYANNKNVKNTNFEGLYQIFLKYLPRSLWIDSTDIQTFQKMNNDWQLVKISLNNRTRR